MVYIIFGLKVGNTGLGLTPLRSFASWLVCRLVLTRYHGLFLLFCLGLVGNKENAVFLPRRGPFSRQTSSPIGED